MDNICDVLDVCKFQDVNVGIVSLDQEKAFHRVNHAYLFSAVRVFGVFLVWVGLLYDGAKW